MVQITNPITIRDIDSCLPRRRRNRGIPFTWQILPLGSLTATFYGIEGDFHLHATMLGNIHSKLVDHYIDRIKAIG